MTSTYTPSLRITKQGTGDNNNTWGTVVNDQVISLLEDAIAGVVSVDCTGSVDVNIATTTVNGGVDTARNMVLELTGTIGANINLIVPSVEKIYLVRAAHTGAYTITVKPSGGASGIAFATGDIALVYTSGTSIYKVSQTITGVLLATNNLSDVANAATARTNISAQAADATLTALAAFNSNGFLVQTAADTFTSRQFTSGTGINITNGTGVGGDVTIAGVAASDTVQGVVELATVAETQTGTDTARAVTPAGIAGSLGFSKMVTSGEVDATIGSSVTTFAHGLGKVPTLVILQLVCKTTEAGYAVGDVIQCGASGYNVGFGTVARSDATNVKVTIGASGFNTVNATTGASVNFASAAGKLTNWKLVITAWA